MTDLVALLREGNRVVAPIEPQKDSPSATTASGDADRLAIELKRKDQLIAALTERLELAAEQLDRQSRTGETRGGRRAAAAIPAGLVAEHQEVVADLRELATRWQESQADVVLERIEQQMLELRDLVAGNLSSTAHATQGHVSDTAGHASGAAGSHEAPHHLKSSASPRLEESSHHDRHAAPVAQPAAEDSRVAAAATDDLPVDLPAPVVFEGLQLPDAIAAICERDKCILKLREKIALTTCSTECCNSPEDIRNRLTELEVIWQEKFRQHELSLSLERARLARDEAEMKQKQERLAKDLSRLNLSKGGGKADNSTPQDSASHSRWMRFLGNGKGGKGRDT